MLADFIAFTQRAGLTQPVGAKGRTVMLVRASAIQAIVPVSDRSGEFTMIFVGETHPLLVGETIEEIREMIETVWGR